MFGLRQRLVHGKLIGSVFAAHLEVRFFENALFLLKFSYSIVELLRLIQCEEDVVIIRDLFFKFL